MQGFISFVTSIVLTLGMLGMSHAATPGKETILDLSDFAGQVRLVNSTSGRVQLSGSGYRLVERDGALVVAKARAQSYFDTSEGCHSDPFANMAVGSGAVAEQYYPGGSSRREGDQAALEIAIPPSTRIRAKAFAGRMESTTSLIGPRIEVAAGRASLAQVIGGELAVNGAGDIVVGETAGQLKVAVTGAGAVRMQGGSLDELTAVLDGAGSIRHDGAARRALLSASGAGEIRVARVETPVRVEQSGFAAVIIGCTGEQCEASAR